MAEYKIIKKATSIMSEGYVCDSCLGRSFAELLSGFSNKERGRVVRGFIAFLIDSGEKIELENSNLYGIKFRNVKIKPKRPKECKICKNFFLEKIAKLAERISKKLKDYEFKTFLIGTILPSDLLTAEERIWEKTGIDFVEPMKNEINRELGKIIENITGKNFDLSNPDMTVIVDMEKDEIKLQPRSLYIYGKYQKLVRGIPQTKWVCRECKGKGCIRCKGEGKMYKTSVQEIVEKPLVKEGKARKSKLHGAGREDVDARCLGKRPFIIELVRPKRRKIGLKKIQSKINKSSKVKVFGLKFSNKGTVKKIKASRYDKTYLANVKFKNKIDGKKLGLLKKLNGVVIKQKTPTRVAHRRSDIMRKRKVKRITTKVIGNKEIEFKITGEAGLYIKELITGDSGRTEPSISELIGNKVKSINLDVIKIHSS